MAGLDQATAKRLTGDKAQISNIEKGKIVKNTSRKPADPYTHDTNPLYTESETPKFDTNTTKYDNSYEAPKEYKMKKEKLEEGGIIKGVSQQGKLIVKTEEKSIQEFDLKSIQLMY